MRPALFFSLCFLQAVIAVKPLVDVGYTKYEGTALPNGVTQWLGVRYAAPPLGNLRFRAPADPTANSTTQMADQHGPICLAVGDTTLNNATSEDCLFLDIYAPSKANASQLAVFIFIQGGGFQSNSNANYNGSGLISASDSNVVIVNFNYRVGPYGFLASKEIVANGNTNNGLLDQRAVFYWVKNYISKFGGDPMHVTIGGDSAGGGSVCLHQTAYGGRDDNLFNATAAESQSFPYQLTVPEAQYQYDTLSQRTGCNSSADTLQCLRTLPIAQLQAANTNFPNPGGVGTPLYSYCAVIDNTLVTDYTYRLFADGKFIRRPAIFGDDTNEGTVFTPKNTSSYQDMNDFLLSNFPQLTQTQLAKIDSLYPKAQQFPNSGPYWRTAANAYGEVRYICPGQYVSSQMASAGVDTWNYRYNVHDPTNYAQGLGTTHTEEISAIWGPANVNGGAPKSYTGINADIVPVLQGYWTSFIRDSNPNTYRAKGTPFWQGWEATKMDRIMFITNGTQMETVDQGQQARCAYLQGIAVSIQQ